METTTSHIEPRAPLNVAVVYDDIAAAERAMRIVGAFAHTDGAGTQLSPSLWPFELLNDRHWQTMATADVSGSDMFIVATSTQKNLPRGVESWLESCLAQGRGLRRAVVALFGDTGRLDSPESPRFQFLQRTAKANGCDFFAPNAIVP